jgi:hypothetical protein
MGRLRITRIRELPRLAALLRDEDHDADLKEIGQAACRITDANTRISVARWGN